MRASCSGSRLTGRLRRQQLARSQARTHELATVQEELSSLVSSQCRLLAFDLEKHPQQEKLARQTRCPSQHSRAEHRSEQGSSVSLVCVPSVKCSHFRSTKTTHAKARSAWHYELIGPSQMHSAVNGNLNMASTCISLDSRALRRFSSTSASFA